MFWYTDANTQETLFVAKVSLDRMNDFLHNVSLTFDHIEDDHLY